MGGRCFMGVDGLRVIYCGWWMKRAMMVDGGSG